jgi:hypothetical protein
MSRLYKDGLRLKLVVKFLNSYRVIVECENSVFAVSTFGLGEN